LDETEESQKCEKEAINEETVSREESARRRARLKRGGEGRGGVESTNNVRLKGEPPRGKKLNPKPNGGEVDESKFNQGKQKEKHK